MLADRGSRFLSWKAASCPSVKRATPAYSEPLSRNQPRAKLGFCWLVRVHGKNTVSQAYRRSCRTPMMRQCGKTERAINLFMPRRHAHIPFPRSIRCRWMVVTAALEPHGLAAKVLNLG